MIIRLGDSSSYFWQSIQTDPGYILVFNVVIVFSIRGALFSICHRYPSRCIIRSFVLVAREKEDERVGPFYGRNCTSPPMKVFYSTAQRGGGSVSAIFAAAYTVQRSCCWLLCLQGLKIRVDATRAINGPEANSYGRLHCY